jgi:hypothetical protein
MAWKIERVPTRLERVGRLPSVVRYEWSAFQSAYGAVWGTATTRRQAEQRLLDAERDLLAGR